MIGDARTKWCRGPFGILISVGVARISPAAVSAVVIAAWLSLTGLASAASSTSTSQPGGPGHSLPSSTPGASTPGSTTGDPGTPVTGVTHTNVVSIGFVGSIDGLSIGICFDEDLDAATATATGNYSINGGATIITNVTLRP